MDKSIIKEYLDEGKQLILLKDKLPLEKNWPNIISSDKKIYGHKGNLGWALGEDDLVIDVDPRNGGAPSWDKLVEEMGISMDATVSTARGGFHCYLEIPKESRGGKLRKTMQKDYPGIDFLTKGSYVVICDSVTKDGSYEWYDEDFGGFDQHYAPGQLLDIISSSQVADNDDDWGFGSFSNWSEEQVVEMLDKLDHNMPNDDWVKVGMALHDWDTEEGLVLWEKWSIGGDTYEEGQAEKRWESFDLGGGVTLGTISYMAKVVDFDDQLQVVKKIIDQISRADEQQMEFNICPKVRKTKLKPFNRERIAKAIQDRNKVLTGVKPAIASIRDMVSDIDIAHGEFIEEGDTSWCDKWVMVNCLSGYFNLNSFSLYKSEMFNCMNGKFVPRVAGAKQRATNFVADNGLLKAVDTVAYLPWEKDAICDLEGKQVLNMFDPRTVPVKAAKFDDEGREAIKCIENHIRFICGNDEDARILTEWLVWQIQFPGKQRLWSPVIQSIEGVGKSFFGALLRTCLGTGNVGTVSSTQVTSDFNGWATNVIVNILEEIKINGKNRYETVNSLKPLITDRYIQINEKGVKPYVTLNTTNYIAFTNHKDAIPVSIDDRRWWLLSVNINSLDELGDIIGEDPDIYFPTLFNSLDKYGDQIRKWALEYPIREKFVEMNRAPMTDYKRSIIATEENSFEGLTEVRDMIETGGKYYNKECISSSDLFDNLVFEHVDIETNNKMKNIILKKLGYMSVPFTVKIDGKSKRIWTKRSMSNFEIRQNFKNWKLEDLKDTGKVGKGTLKALEF